MSWTFSSPDRGRHIFADVLARYAAQTCDGRLGAVERRVRAAVRVAVTGRQGVGPSSVAAALSGATSPSHASSAAMRGLSMPPPSKRGRGA